MRLQKYIAYCGVASRRKAEELIKLGKVKINGQIITDMGVTVEPSIDEICVNDQVIKPEKSKVYIMLNKPEGYVTTLSDEFSRPTVVDLTKSIAERIYPVGRLDYGTSGLLIMTNDGDLAYQLTHPKHEVSKTYIAKIMGEMNKNEINQFQTGIDIGGYITAPAHIETLEKQSQISLVQVMIHEGKNRQIRRMFDKINHPVVQLKRIAIGELNLNKLHLGKWRHLVDEEINYLKSL